jgi:hypothetical protein
MHPNITPGSVRQPVRAPVRRTVETELRHLPTSDLETLRRSLRRQLAELPVGSPASRLIGRLCRIARIELGRLRTPDGPPRRLIAITPAGGCRSRQAGGPRSAGFDAEEEDT